MSARFLTWARTVPIKRVGQPSVRLMRHVLHVLADYARTDGRAWPSVDRLAEDVGAAPTSVRRALGELERQGLIVAVFGRSGGRRPTTWRLAVAPEWEPPEPGRGERVEPGRGERVEGEPTRSQGPPNPVVTTAQPGRDDRRSRKEPAENPQVQGDSPPNQSPSPSSEPSNQDDAQLRAWRVLSPWWKHQHPEPQQPFGLALTALARAARGGWSDADLAAAVEAMGTPLSGGSLDLWRSRQANGSSGGLTDEQHQIIHELNAMGDATMAEWAERRAGWVDPAELERRADRERDAAALAAIRREEAQRAAAVPSMDESVAAQKRIAALRRKQRREGGP